MIMVGVDKGVASMDLKYLYLLKYNVNGFFPFLTVAKCLFPIILRRYL
jgi:hypothetical protein